MAITLYKHGNTHEVRGVQCELKNFDVNQLDYALSLGYVADVNTLKEPDMSVKEIRMAAKEAGIRGYSKRDARELLTELNQ